MPASTPVQKSPSTHIVESWVSTLVSTSLPTVFGTVCSIERLRSTSKRARRDVGAAADGIAGYHRNANLRGERPSRHGFERFNDGAAMSDLYETDVIAWSERQADLLRR